MLWRGVTTWFVVLAILGMTACAGMHSEDEETTQQPKEDRQTLAESNNQFALTLYSRLAEEAGDKNLFVSPFSISSALGMTYAGARGETAEQMKSVLELNLPDERLHPAFASLNKQLNTAAGEEAYQLNTANALWGQEDYDFLDEFVNLTQEYYGAGLRRVDYRTAAGREDARETINSWVSEETQGKIEELISRGVLTNLTRLVLTNAVYFKGLWASPFDQKRTEKAPFTLADGSTTEADMMYQKHRFGYLEMEGGTKLLEMPYKGDELSMVVLLPPEADGLDELEQDLSRERLTGWLGKAHPREVKVYLPRFEMTWKTDLVKTLKAMGMEDAFSLPPADFSGMTGEKDLFISNVVHKAYVKVDEEGTEAAAATGVVVGITSVQPDQPVFRADHPFLFCIRHRETGSILFMGRVMDPAS